MNHQTQARFVLSGLSDEELEQCATSLSEELSTRRGVPRRIVRYDRLRRRIVVEFEPETAGPSANSEASQALHRELRESLWRTRWIASGVTVEVDAER